MSEPTRSFPLAPMCPLIRWLTVGLCLVLAALAAAAISGTPALWIPVALMAALYAAVWLCWRPSRFEVSSRGLAVRFPAWTRFIPGDLVAGAHEVSRAAFRDEFGWALRIGVGGLWGGFGWLWTRKKGLVEFYISRVDNLVVVERREGKPLLITPSEPAAFVRAVVA